MQLAERAKQSCSTSLYPADAMTAAEQPGLKRSRTIIYEWRSNRLRSALRMCAACGPSVRVVGLTESRKRPTRRI